MSHNLHAQIMNLPCEGTHESYKIGHRDARHAAAELANAADETIETLRAALTTTSEGNARLIEQRDELLEIAKGAVELINGELVGSEWKKACHAFFKQARAAIAKAEQA